uniref:Uncharacterized protein n=1 Tax=Anguilla anguilla TaxID=7936 RepID=A0A0E9XKY4_ANGAN
MQNKKLAKHFFSFLGARSYYNKMGQHNKGPRSENRCDTATLYCLDVGSVTKIAC